MNDLESYLLSFEQDPLFYEKGMVDVGVIACVLKAVREAKIQTALDDPNYRYIILPAIGHLEPEVFEAGMDYAYEAGLNVFDIACGSEQSVSDYQEIYDRSEEGKHETREAFNNYKPWVSRAWRYMGNKVSGFDINPQSEDDMKIFSDYWQGDLLTFDFEGALQGKLYDVIICQNTLSDNVCPKLSERIGAAMHQTGNLNMNDVDYINAQIKSIAAKLERTIIAKLSTSIAPNGIAIIGDRMEYRTPEGELVHVIMR